MATVQQKITEFAQHTHERKKELVGIMLEELKDANDNYREIYRIFHEMDDVSDETLMTIYQEIIELAESQKNDNKQLAENALNQAQIKLHAMLEQEQLQRQQDLAEAEALLADL